MGSIEFFAIIPVVTVGLEPVCLFYMKCLRDNATSFNSPNVASQWLAPSPHSRKVLGWIVSLCVEFACSPCVASSHSIHGVRWISDFKLTRGGNVSVTGWLSVLVLQQTGNMCRVYPAPDMKTEEESGSMVLKSKPYVFRNRDSVMCLVFSEILRLNAFQKKSPRFLLTH